MENSPKTVADVMTRTVVALSGGATFKDIAKTMKQWRGSALPLLGDGGRVIGRVSQAALLRQEETRGSDPPGRGVQRRPPQADNANEGPADPPQPAPAPDTAAAAPAEQLMTAPPLTVTPDAPPARAARIMARRGVKRLPVVDGDGVLQGIVSRADLLKVFLRGDDEIAREIRGVIASARVPASMAAVSVDARACAA